MNNIQPFTAVRHLSVDGVIPPSNLRRPPFFKRSSFLGIVAVILALFLAFVGFRMNSEGSVGNRATRAAPRQSSIATSDILSQLPPPDLLKSVSPEDAKVANETRPVVARPDTAPVGFSVTGDASSRMRAIDCLTQAVYYEAASEGLDGGRAVAQVVLNRMRHPAYPNSVCGVVYQGSGRPTGCQFTFTCDGSLARSPLKYLWARSRDIATLALGGKVFAAVGHATHYHADYVLPYWADSLDKVAVIGRHIFYRLKGTSGSVGAFRQRYAAVEPLPTPPPLASVIEESLQSIESGSAAVSALPLPKVVEDNVASLAPGTKAGSDANSPLRADLSRGSLIVGEPNGESRKEVRAPVVSCAGKGDRQITAVGATDMRAAIVKPNC